MRALVPVLALIAALVPARALAAEAPHDAHPGHGHATEVPHGQEADADHAHAAGDHAEGEHHGLNYPAIFFNFAVFAGALVLVLRKPARAFFRERRLGIVHSFEAAEEATRQARARLQETEARLASLDAQVQGILTRAEEQAVAERELILQAAQAEATRILAQAESQVSDLEADSVRRLKVVAAELSVEMARDILEKQLQPEDRQRMFDRALKSLAKATH